MQRVLLLKPFQPVAQMMTAPPLGLIYLASQLRERFEDRVEIRVVDMKVRRLDPDWVLSQIDEFEPQVVGVSALNVEANASHRIAEIVQQHAPGILTVLGGPYSNHRAAEILENSLFDWVVAGPGDHVFPEALARHFAGSPLGTDLPGLSYRHENGVHVSEKVDAIQDIDALAIPAWDLIEFDLYRGASTFIPSTRRHAHIFTSRGCPYKCWYCHDIFGKRFRYHSVERVIAEIELLVEEYGVTAFEIVDDIFNLHKPRLKAIMAEVQRRWGRTLHFGFPNGVRGDLLDEEVLDALRDAGTVSMTIAVETVTERLQKLIEKNLDIEKVRWAIDAADRRGILVTGFFMVGFPTETPEELQATIDFAFRSRLTAAHFFTVVPQPGTPLYELAGSENAVALEKVRRAEMSGGSYEGTAAWYEMAYGFPLQAAVRRANLRFYLGPWRLWRIATRVPVRAWFQSVSRFVMLTLRPRAIGWIGRAGSSSLSR